MDGVGRRADRLASGLRYQASPLPGYPSAELIHAAAFRLFGTGASAGSSTSALAGLLAAGLMTLAARSLPTRLARGVLVAAMLPSVVGLFELDVEAFRCTGALRPVLVAPGLVTRDLRVRRATTASAAEWAAADLARGASGQRYGRTASWKRRAMTA